tara:strand:+ start:484 stop:672 length:189 start_codon:yes stop_codon:yes gene_type:complete
VTRGARDVWDIDSTRSIDRPARIDRSIDRSIESSRSIGRSRFDRNLESIARDDVGAGCRSDV